jgi:hypothetical protein
MSTTFDQRRDRRAFISTMASGSVALAASGIALSAIAPTVYAQPSEAQSDDWLAKINGTHKQFFDGVTVNDGWALGYALNFLNANNEAYKLADTSLTAVVGLRHFAAPLGLTDAIWAKYKLGEFLKLNDPGTKQPLVRNMYFHPHDGELLLPDMAIEHLMHRGTIFTVCNLAITILSSLTAKTAGVTPDVAKKEWVAGIIPGMHLVPAGVLAVNRAQEKGCSYCYSG